MKEEHGERGWGTTKGYLAKRRNVVIQFSLCIEQPSRRHGAPGDAERGKTLKNGKKYLWN